MSPRYFAWRLIERRDSFPTGACGDFLQPLELPRELLPTGHVRSTLRGDPSIPIAEVPVTGQHIVTGPKISTLQERHARRVLTAPGRPPLRPGHAAIR